MEQYSKNENTCDVFMNEVKMEDEPLPKPKKNGSFQTKGSRNFKMNDNNLKKLYAQRDFGEQPTKCIVLGILLC
jgi:hypothetical protein